jgi:hypothetical protein
MGLFKTIYRKTNLNVRDISDLFGPLFMKEGYTSDFLFIGSEKHMIYTNGSFDFDFWWERGNRPVLFLKRYGVAIETDIYQALIKKSAGHIRPIGAQIFFIYSKLDKEIYYKEHYDFVLKTLSQQ